MVPTQEITKVRIKFSKVGDLMYISHLDLARTMQRIILRSELDIWYSEGFNPQPKMVFAQPLPTGVESVCELLDIKLNSYMDCEEIKELWANFKGRPQELGLPTAPKQFLHYFEENDRPQAKLDRDLEGGMAVSIGRLRPDTQYDYKFVCLSHNTLRGAAGGAVLLAELLCAEGYIDHKE